MEFLFYLCATYSNVVNKEFDKILTSFVEIKENWVASVLVVNGVTMSTEEFLIKVVVF